MKEPDKKYLDIIKKIATTGNGIRNAKISISSINIKTIKHKQDINTIKSIHNTLEKTLTKTITLLNRLAEIYKINEYNNYIINQAKISMRKLRKI